MNRIFLIVFLLTHILVSRLNGSELPDSSFIWTISHIEWGTCEGVSTYRISGDTLINNKAYKQIFTTSDSVFSELNSNYFCATRDSAGLWYFIPGWDSTEYLLYDFNVSLGETIRINNPWTFGEVDAYVISKDSILIEDEYKTRIGIGARQGEVWEYWIEDIGCLSGLFYSCFFIFDTGYQLTCTYSQGSFYHNFGFDGFCGCGPGTSIERVSNFAQVSIYPNPSRGIMSINNHSQTPLTICFYSINGRLIDQIKVESYATNTVKVNYLGNMVICVAGDGILDRQIIQVLK
jgi:hypothetical protein